MQGMRSNISFPSSPFAVHIDDFIPLYASRAIVLTQSKLRLIVIAQKRYPSSFCQLIQTEKVWHWMFIHLRFGEDYSTVSPTYGSILFLSSFAVSLIGCHGTTSVLTSVFRCESLGVKLVRSQNFPENHRMEHNIRFCLSF